jgi:hypothetical protein
MISGTVSTSHCEATTSNFGSYPVCIANMNLRCSPHKEGVGAMPYRVTFGDIPGTGTLRG